MSNHPRRPHFARLRLACTTAALTLLAAACSTGGDDGGADAGADSVANAATETALIRSVALVIASDTAAFSASALALDAAVDTLGDGADADARAAAQAAWIETMTTWQRLEMLQIGPAATMAASPGGLGLRDEIYSWPLDNPCRVDQETVAQGYAETDFLDQAPNVRGLDALEYLLFAEGDGNACAPNSAINADGSWAALGAAEVRSRRAAYAAVLSELLVARAAELATAWDADSGLYFADFVAAGAGSTGFPTRRAALNGISNALFYLDKETKDMKLARPMGLAGCAEATCPDEAESPLAGSAIGNVAENVRAFSRAYHGGEPGGAGIGFHELLVAIGAQDLASSMADAVATALELADAPGPTLAERLESDPDGVMALYDAVKVVTDLLKTQFVGVLDLELPDRAAGDND